MAAPVQLSELTTLGLGGPAPRLHVAESTADVIETLTELDRDGERVLVVGGGSNLVIADAGVDYPVLQIMSSGVQHALDGADLLVTVAAGENWDGVVAALVDDGWCGIEMLSGIPGSTGATPIQNVGAYGAEISEVLVEVTVFDRTARAVRTVSAAELSLGYRSSVLRGQSNLIVLTTRMRLSRTQRPIRFGELATTLGTTDGAPPAEVRAAVLALRRGKGMVLDPQDPDTRSVGSFFTNPLVTPDEADAFGARVEAIFGPGVPYQRFPAGDRIKLSAAWLIERAGFHKGFALPRGGAAISSKHTLALTNRGGTTADLIDLARHVRDGVQATFGVQLHPEPIMVGVEL